jgi:hypothetical protein
MRVSSALTSHHHLRRDFHSPNLCRVVQDLTRSCSTCQRYKSEHLHTLPAYLCRSQSLPQCGRTFGLILSRPFLATMASRHSGKYCHFIALTRPYTTVCGAGLLH